MFLEYDDPFVLLFLEILAIALTMLYPEMRLHIYAATDRLLPRKKEEKIRKKSKKRKDEKFKKSIKK